MWLLQFSTTRYAIALRSVSCTMVERNGDRSRKSRACQQVTRSDSLRLTVDDSREMIRHTIFPNEATLNHPMV